MFSISFSIKHARAKPPMRCRRWCCKSFMKHRSYAHKQLGCGISKAVTKRCLQIVGVTAIRMLKFANYPRENRDSSSGRCAQCARGEGRGRGKKRGIRRYRHPAFAQNSIYLFIRATTINNAHAWTWKNRNVDALSFFPSPPPASFPRLRKSPHVLCPFLSIIN